MCVLYTVDRDDHALHDGDPVVLVEHRPGSPVTDLSIELSEQVPAAAAAFVHTHAADQLLVMIEDAFDSAGMFDGERLLGCNVSFLAQPGTFERDTSYEDG